MNRRIVVSRPSHRVLWPLAALGFAVPCGAASAQNLSQISNLKQMNKLVKLQPSQRKLLAKNGFVCAPTTGKQLFHILEHNDYNNAPSFISTDALLQLYHIFFDFTLRKTETDKLSPLLKNLTATMLQSAQTDAGKSAGEWQNAAQKNVAFFAVAERALGGNAPLSPQVGAMVAREMALMNAHSGFAVGAIFPYKIDYSQFIARGHYTRSEVLRRYFRAMMWYGLTPFAVRTNGKLNATQIRQGILLTRALYANGGIKTWQRIYEPTSFYVGFSDDLTPAQWKGAMDRTFGAGANVREYSQPGKFAAFVSDIEKLRAARIQARFAIKMGVPENTTNIIRGPLPDAVQLRFMGQRDVPDAEITQRLSVPLARPFPSGLDVLSVIGSTRATAILDAYPQIYNPKGWGGYRAQRAKIAREFARQPASKWSSNLYWSWLDVLRALAHTPPKNAPRFMKTSAWQDKTLNTALASWAELKHDTVLYGKQSAVEGGGEAPPPVKGYVEPNIAFWNRLGRLTRQSRDGLLQRGLLSAEMQERFSEYGSMIARLKTISEKELRNQKLTRDDYDLIRYLGAQIDTMTLSVAGDGVASDWTLVNETDRDMAIVTDVHTSANSVLQEGVGHAYELLVVVPIEGKQVLTRGSAFSYYEFTHPSSDRLTDEKWQKMLTTNRAPRPPIWTKSFLAPLPAKRIDRPDSN